MKKIHRLFWLWEYDKEEKWLNNMSAKGLQLCGVSFMTYYFEEGAPGEYIYRMEMLKKYPAHADSAEYIRFVEDTGAELIGSLLRWVYFRKKAGAEGFEILSDLGSRVGMLNRILFLTGLISLTNFLNGLNLLRRWYTGETGFGLFVPILCLSLGLVVGYGFLVILKKKLKLDKERVIHE